MGFNNVYQKRGVYRYGLALLIFLVALIVHLWLQHVELCLSFLIFYPAIVFGFYLCGLGPGILLMGLSSITSHYLFSPKLMVFPYSTTDLFSFAIFLVSSIIISRIVWQLQHYTQKLNTTLTTLQETQQYYLSVLEEQTESICRIKADDTLVYVNDAFCRLFEKSRESLIGQKWYPIVYDEDIQLINDKLNTLSPDNPVVTVENRIITQDGILHWVQFVNRGFFDDKGQLIEMQSIGRDITAIRQTRDQLSKSEQLFRTLAESVPQIVWMTDPDGLNTYFNQQWVDYTGLTLAESYGHGWNKPFHPDDQERAWQAWKQAIATDGIYSLECRLRRADGVYRWWLIRGVSLHDDDGNIINWFGTCTDIQDIKVAEETRQMLEKRLNLALEFSDLGVWDLDLNNDTTWRTLKHDQIFGYQTSQSEWNVDIAKQHVVPEDRELFSHCFKEAFNTGKLSIECRIIHKDGSLHWINAQGRVLYDEQGQPTQMLGTVADITERKLLEKEMALAATIFDSQEGMFITDTNKQVLRVNRAFTRITGYTQADMQGKNPHILSSGIHDANFYRAMWAAINDNDAWESEIWNRRKNGEIYPEYLIITAVKDANNTIINYVGTFNDITPIKNAEQKLQDAYQQLQQSLEAQIQQEKLASLGVLIGGLAHEINNPLMGILNYIQFVYDKTNESRNDEMLSKALKEVNRIAKLVRGMLTFVYQPSDPLFSDVASTLERVLGLIEGDLKRHDIELQVDLPPTLSQQLVAADTLEQILLNLLLNAIYCLKNRPKPRLISLTVRQQRNMLELLIQDNGTGVAEDIRQKIFDPFFTTKPPGEGTGLGLAISKRIAETANGSLELADSKQGACFALRLPVNLQ